MAVPVRRPGGVPRVAREEVRVEQALDDLVQALAELAARLEHAQLAVDARIRLLHRAAVLCLERDEEREEAGEEQCRGRGDDGRVDRLRRQGRGSCGDGRRGRGEGRGGRRRVRRRAVGECGGGGEVGRVEGRERRRPVRRQDRPDAVRPRRRLCARRAVARRAWRCPTAAARRAGRRAGEVRQPPVEDGAVAREDEDGAQEGDLGVGLVLGHVVREGRQARRHGVAADAQLGEEGEDHALDGDVVLGEDEAGMRVEHGRRGRVSWCWRSWRRRRRRTRSGGGGRPRLGRAGARGEQRCSL